MTTLVVVSSHGFTIQAIEHYMASDGSVTDNALEPIMLEYGETLTIGISDIKSVTIREIKP